MSLSLKLNRASLRGHTTPKAPPALHQSAPRARFTRTAPSRHCIPAPTLPSPHHDPVPASAARPASAPPHAIAPRSHGRVSPPGARTNARLSASRTPHGQDALEALFALPPCSLRLPRFAPTLLSLPHNPAPYTVCLCRQFCLHQAAPRPTCPRHNTLPPLHPRPHAPVTSPQPSLPHYPVLPSPSHLPNPGASILPCDLAPARCAGQVAGVSRKLPERACGRAVYRGEEGAPRGVEGSVRERELYGAWVVG
jgi:hypothetical protein